MRVQSLSPKGGLSVLYVGLWALVGCGGGESPQGGAGDAAPPRAAEPMPAEVQALVDEGNAAQRAGEYQRALDSYREGMQLAPDHPVPQFGGLMAALALGETALADSLRALLEVSAPDLLAMLGPGNVMGGDQGAPSPGSAGAMGGGMPPGHPNVTAPPVDTMLPDTAGTR